MDGGGKKKNLIKSYSVENRKQGSYQILLIATTTQMQIKITHIIILFYFYNLRKFINVLEFFEPISDTKYSMNSPFFRFLKQSYYLPSVYSIHISYFNVTKYLSIFAIHSPMSSCFKKLKSGMDSFISRFQVPTKCSSHFSGALKLKKGNTLSQSANASGLTEKKRCQKIFLELLTHLHTASGPCFCHFIHCLFSIQKN